MIHVPALLLGLDIGSTTVKAALLDSRDGRLLWSDYQRHGARQVECAAGLLRKLSTVVDTCLLRIAVCGSGGKPIAEACGFPFIQEVLAGSMAVRHAHPQARTAIELGGQDAKIIFFHHDPETGEVQASDMRMNGSCAGGTGAFIDEVASILHVGVEEIDALASRGSHVFDISGRCGVFAKTDIQPLLNHGVPKADIALSALHAVVKQTVGGLAQGLEIHGPVVFLGGPLGFIPRLVKAFSERLGLCRDTTLLPEDPETFVARGAALALDRFFAKQGAGPVDLARLPERLEAFQCRQPEVFKPNNQPFFATPGERRAFLERHPRQTAPDIPPDIEGIYIGIDGGSTTSKCVALDPGGRVLGAWYSHNRGNPLEVMIGLLRTMGASFAARGPVPKVLGVGTTGYAEQLFATAFKADWHTVETVSHATAALHFVPDASFVLDIGGQDMKALILNSGIISGIVLNEACSAGCGSFLENFAASLGIPVDKIAERAFAAPAPSSLGSRCTVFMNSSIITELKNGKGPDDIMAGLCRSIIENVFTKVMRLPSFEHLGSTIVVQGGTFKNDAVLRAMEQYTGRRIVRAPWPGEMGAIGIALLTMEHQNKQPRRGGDAPRSSFIGFEALDALTWTQESGITCTLCSNNCARTIIRFADGSTHVSGNRCERGEITEPRPGPAPGTGRQPPTHRSKVSDLVRERNELYFRAGDSPALLPTKDITIGIPRVLEFYNSYPFWQALFTSLGFRVLLSPDSSNRLFQSGLQYVPSDTVCFPAKIAHGHIQALIKAGVDRIFMPMINRMPPENPGATANQVCAVVKGYPLVLDYSDEPGRRHGIPFDHPMFHWFQIKDRNRQISGWFAQTFGIGDAPVRDAIAVADRVMARIRGRLVERGNAVIASLRSVRPTPPCAEAFAVVLAGRPYHGDRLVNHDLGEHFLRHGIPVLPIDALEGLDSVDISRTRAEPTNAFHVRLFAAAILVARNPVLELVQIVSFGCGHDAVLSDEICGLMQRISGKTPLILKLDESDVKGPLAVRVRSFVETVRARRCREPSVIRELDDPFPVKFRPRDRATKTILVPNVTPAWSRMISAAIASEGYRVEPLPMADRAAIQLGKEHVHNDMCYPAQVNIGEMLGALKSGRYDPSTVVCGMGKVHCDCRLAHYAALARKALDSSGFSEVPIVTTDTVDAKAIHPAFRLGLRFQMRTIWGNTIIDVLEHIQRRLRPYELVPGQTAELFNEAVERISTALARSVRRALAEYEAALDRFAVMPARLQERRPRVFIIGEYLLNFHDASNMGIVDWLERHGREVVLPDTFMIHHRDFLKKDSEHRLFGVSFPVMEVFATRVSLAMIARVKRVVHQKARRLPFLDEPVELGALAAATDHLMHHTFTPGEGWLIVGEILHQVALGVDSFVILQPFGCIPNHVVGRGMMKKIKEIHPHIRIVALDFDPDTSFANIENRLQMLVMAHESRR